MNGDGRYRGNGNSRGDRGGGRGGGRGGSGSYGGGGRGGGGGGGARDRPMQKMREGPIIGPLTIQAKAIAGTWADPQAVNFKPPQGKSTGVLKMRTIAIETNHVATRIKFPDKIYHYEITVTYGDRLTNKPKAGSAPKPGHSPRKLAAAMGACSLDTVEKPVAVAEVRPKLWKKVVNHVIPEIERRHKEKGGVPLRVASDYSKALYTTRPLLGIEEFYKVDAKRMTDESEDSTSSFIVVVAATKSVIETKALSETVNNMRGKEVANIAEIEQIYNIVLKTLPIHQFIHVGRASFFTVPKDDGFELGGGLVNIGGFSSIYTFGWKAFINIDIANSAFVLGRDVLDVIKNLFDSEFRHLSAFDVSKWGPRELARVNELLKTCQISYTRESVPMRRRIEEVVARRPRDVTFEVDKTKTNVEAYFEGKGITLRYPNGPCLVIGKNKATIPAELCTIDKGQSFTKKLSDYQTAAMIKDTAKPPEERKRRILESIRACRLEEDAVLKEFGVAQFNAGQGSAKLLQFENTRLLNTPELCYGDQGKQKISPTDGVWNIWEHDFRFIVPIQVKKWRILYMNTRNNSSAHKTGSMDLERFVASFRRLTKLASMGIPDYDGVDGLDCETTSFENELHKYFGKLQYGKESFVLVIIPSKNHICYGTIKKVAELGPAGVLTQCVTYANIGKQQSATIGNIIMKLNAKLGGVNHCVDLTSKISLTNSQIDFVRFPILLLGADVTHPSANSLMPSVAAVTASYDRYGMQYCMHPQVQQRADKNAAEVIENLDLIVKKMINNYRLVNGSPPKKIIFFRDGIGEGQYAEVLCKELGALRKACKLASGSDAYQPKITFITVQKRHKTRFFVKNERDGIGKSRNCPPGAIIDTEIVHPTEMDFYLLSHQGIQGTSRPTRYHLLWDDSNFSSDEIQLLSYGLCHAYSRCARTVSIPAPTYYAHLAAYRVRCQIEAMNQSTYDNIARLNELVCRNEKLIQDYPMHFI